MTPSFRHETIFVQVQLSLTLLTVFYLGALLLAGAGRENQHWIFTKPVCNFKIIALHNSIISFVLVTLTVYHFHFIAGTARTINFTLWHSQVPLALNDLTLLFLLLVSFLFPGVIILTDFDFNPRAYKYILALQLVYLVTNILIMCTDLLMFYVFYELLVLLMFFAMYLSTNARGCVEAALFFLGWAVVGSIFVGIAVIYIINVTGTTNFHIIRHTTFTSDEIFLLYTLSFFGFGTKLSLWPFWYWLPRAHVEVSTAMSVFLSCILIKICLYCLIRFWWLINSEVVVSPFIFLVALCVFDVTCRLIIQTDLKAVIAYGSVLHVNLLVLLVLLDTTNLTLGTVLYIWGHSLATGGLFFATNLIERCHGSRATFEISGVYNTNPLVGLVAIFAVIGFLDFPLTVFFWGELWLWITLFSTIPITAAVLMFISAVIYIIVFFRIWWGVIFGASSHLAKYPITTLTWNDLHTAAYLILPQYICGLQPNIFYLFVIS